jgi:pyrroloquinoline quinone biosynthesis protein D
MGPERFPRQRERILAQRMDDTLLLLDPHGGQYFALDEVGVRVWGMCDGAHSVAQMVALLAAEYDAPAATIEADVVELLAELASEKLVVD